MSKEQVKQFKKLVGWGKNKVIKTSDTPREHEKDYERKDKEEKQHLG